MTHPPEVEPDAGLVALKLMVPDDWARMAGRRVKRMVRYAVVGIVDSGLKECQCVWRDGPVIEWIKC